MAKLRNLWDDPPSTDFHGKPPHLFWDFSSPEAAKIKPLQLKQLQTNEIDMENTRISTWWRTFHES